MARRPNDHRSARTSPLRWSPARRTIVSILVSFHLIAVVVAPWSSPPPSSRLSLAARQWFAPYLQMLAIDNGYRFFAPDPGPGHVVVYELTMPDGSLVKGQFPDRDGHWPRLLYHRHFMVSETLFSLAAPVAAPPPEDAPKEELAAWQHQRNQADQLIQSIAADLLRRNGAKQVKLTLRTHEIPSDRDFLSGVTLTDPRLLVVLPVGDHVLPVGDRGEEKP